MTQQELVRSVYAKVTGESDMDWIELAQASGQGLHPDQLRKMGQGIKLVADAGMLSQDGQSPDDPYALQKMRDLRKEMNEHFRAEARSDALRDAVMDAARRMAPVEKPLNYPPALDGPMERCLVVAIGDMHYGAEWSVTGLMGEPINRYSPEVFEARMWTLLGELAKILCKERIHHVKLMICGDALDGMLRNSQLMKLRYGMVESCMKLAEFLTCWIASLRSDATVSVFGVDGNHGEIRPLGSRKGEFGNENLEKILMWYLAARFEDDDHVYIDPVSEKLKLVDVLGYRFLMVHGEDAKGLEAQAKQSILLYGQQLDFIICAHKHREQEAVTGYMDDGNTLVMRVPSVCGMDRFAQKLGYGGKAGALAMVMEKGYGRQCVYPIMLS